MYQRIRVGRGPRVTPLSPAPALPPSPAVTAVSHHWRETLFTLSEALPAATVTSAPVVATACRHRASAITGVSLRVRQGPRGERGQTTLDHSPRLPDQCRHSLRQCRWQAVRVVMADPPAAPTRPHPPVRRLQRCLLQVQPRSRQPTAIFGHLLGASAAE